MLRVYGYTRVSHKEQNAERQVEALTFLLEKQKTV